MIYIKAVLFDLIGTTVIERNPMTITNCFIDSFSKNGITIEKESVKRNRGKDKSEIVESILTELGQPLDKKEAILHDYKANLEKNINNFCEDVHLREITTYLKKKSIIIGVGTGLSRDFLNKLTKHFNWESIGFDYTGTSEEIRSGRPHPGMIFDMMKKFRVNNNEFLKIGDTVVDIQEGRNAKVKTAALLTGTQNKEDILNEEPNYILESLGRLKDII